MRRSQIKKDAKKLEEWVEVRSGLKHARSTHVNVGGMHRTTRSTEFGDAVCYRGTERLGVLIANPGTNPGEVLDRWDLNPTAFGAILPLYSRPFSKFMFKKVTIHQLNEIAFVNDDNEGSTYIGINYDPTAEIPIGNGGVDAMAAWYKNHMVVPLRRGSCNLNCELKLEAQIPLFIQKNGEPSVESQATIAAIAGTELALHGAPVAIGEVFISFEVEFYEMNPSSGDLGTAGVTMYATGVPGTTLCSNYFNSFIGSPNVILPVSTPANGNCFMMLSDGVYIFDFEWVAIGGTQSSSSNPGSLVLVRDGSPTQSTTSIVQTPWATDLTAVPQSWTQKATFGNYVDASGPHIIAGLNNGHSSYSVVCAAGTVLALTSATVPSSTTPALHDIILTVQRVDNSYYPGGVVPVRSQSQFFTTLAQKRLIRRVMKALEADTKARCLTAAEKFVFINWVIQNGQSEPAYANLLIDALDLGVPKYNVTSMMPPLIAGALAWAAATFGPLVAQKVIDFISDKLKAHMSPKK